jgi:hypothetical protein
VTQFSYRSTKYGTVFIERGGRRVTTLHGASATRFAAAMETANAKGKQELMARAAGLARRVTERGD